MSEKRIITVEEVKAKTPERFWSKVKFRESNECWEWHGQLNNKGYGQYDVMKNWVRERWLCHRFAYYYTVLQFDKKLHCLHSCDNPKCVNPNHLFLGTQLDNMHDMIKKNRAVHIPFIGSAHGCAKLNEKKVKEIIVLLSQGKSCEYISKMYGVGNGTIVNIRSGKTWTHVKSNLTIPYRKGNQKLTENQVRIIKMRLRAGESGASIGREFKVGTDTISLIKRGVRWGYVKI